MSVVRRNMTQSLRIQTSFSTHIATFVFAMCKSTYHYAWLKGWCCRLNFATFFAKGFLEVNVVSIRVGNDWSGRMLQTWWKAVVCFILLHRRSYWKIEWHVKRLQPFWLWTPDKPTTYPAKSWMSAVVCNLKFKLADRDVTKGKYVEL